MFKGSMVAIATPMQADGGVDFNALDRLVDFHLENNTDVIIPAAEIFLKALEWSGSSEIYVPKVGLADGMVRLLYRKYGSHV